MFNVRFDEMDDISTKMLKLSNINNKKVKGDVWGMLLIGLMFFTIVLLGLHAILSKGIDNSVGSGLGQRNNEQYGMDTKNEK